jgi:hypothetical protein
MKTILDQLMKRGDSRRDQAIRDAFALVPGRSFHLRVIAFGRAICRFETAWRRNGGAPPRRLNAFTEALSRARKTNGERLPSNEYDLAEILRNE